MTTKTSGSKKVQLVTKETIPFTNNKPESKAQDWKLEDNFCLFDNPSNEYLVKAVPEIYVKEFLQRLKEELVFLDEDGDFNLLQVMKGLNQLAGKSLVESK